MADRRRRAAAAPALPRRRVRSHRLLGVADGGRRRRRGRRLCREREHGLKLVYGAVAAVIGLQLIGATLELFSPSDTLTQTALVLRITTAAGALVLVHNVYGQAAPASRSHIRLAAIGLALIWFYD